MGGSFVIPSGPIGGDSCTGCELVLNAFCFLRIIQALGLSLEATHLIWHVEATQLHKVWTGCVCHNPWKTTNSLWFGATGSSLAGILWIFWSPGGSHGKGTRGSHEGLQGHRGRVALEPTGSHGKGALGTQEISQEEILAVVGEYTGTTFSQITIHTMRQP